MNFLIRLLADYLVVPIVITAIVVVLRLPRQRLKPAILRGVGMALTAYAFAKIAAQFYQGVRPFETLGVAPEASFLPNPGFPSDHALFVFTLTIIVWAATRRRTTSLLMLLGSIAVSVGRVAALVHTPLDVIGGAVCALLAGLIWYGPKLRQQYAPLPAAKPSTRRKPAAKKLT